MSRGRTVLAALGAGRGLEALRRRVGLHGWGRRKVLFGIRAGALVALAVAALATPGFTSIPNIMSLVTSLSFLGCVAVGMTFITISGNIMSFCLGATVSAVAMVFMASLGWGVPIAIVLALATGVLISLAQGLVVGYFRANPIIVAIAALTLITGGANVITAGRRVYAAAPGADVLKGKLAGIPVELLVFLAVVVVGQFLLTKTQFGRNVYMVGSNMRAATVTGIRTWRTVSGAFLLAGAFSACSGILMGARYSFGDMELAVGFDYDAIAAVLVGGTAIQGGEGSVLRTLLGMMVIATVQSILLLHGFSKELQYLITGLIVLAAIMLQTIGGRD